MSFASRLVAQWFPPGLSAKHRRVLKRGYGKGYSEALTAKNILAEALHGPVKKMGFGPLKLSARRRRRRK